VIRVRGTSAVARAAMLSAACTAVAACAGYGVAAAGTSAFAAHPAAAHATPTRYCAYEIATPTAAEVAAIERYWTPVARSAVAYVSQGKMIIAVPKRRLTRPQRLALRRLRWAERAFPPRPRLVCEQLAPGGAATGGASARSE